MTILVTFAWSRLTSTVALPVVLCNRSSAFEALVTTLPFPSMVVEMIGRTEVML